MQRQPGQGQGQRRVPSNASTNTPSAPVFDSYTTTIRPRVQRITCTNPESPLSLSLFPSAPQPSAHLDPDDIARHGLAARKTLVALPLAAILRHAFLVQRVIREEGVGEKEKEGKRVSEKKKRRREKRRSKKVAREQQEVEGAAVIAWHHFATLVEGRWQNKSQQMLPGARNTILRLLIERTDGRKFKSLLYTLGHETPFCDSYRRKTKSYRKLLYTLGYTTPFSNPCRCNGVAPVYWTTLSRHCR